MAEENKTIKVRMNTYELIRKIAFDRHDKMVNVIQEMLDYAIDNGYLDKDKK